METITDDDYESLRETVHVMRSQATARRLLDAIERLEARGTDVPGVRASGGDGSAHAT